MQEQVGDRLPDAQMENDVAGREPEPGEPEIQRGAVVEQLRNLHQEENGDGDQAERLNGAREIPAQVKTIAVAAGKGAHEASLKASGGRVKVAWVRDGHTRNDPTLRARLSPSGYFGEGTEVSRADTWLALHMDENVTPASGRLPYSSSGAETMKSSAKPSLV